MRRFCLITGLFALSLALTTSCGPASNPEPTVEPSTTPQAAPAAAVPTQAAPELTKTEYLAAGDPGNGARLFAQCQACHALEPDLNLVGPTLHNLIGRPAGQIEGFRYSKANAESGYSWTEEILFDYLENPRRYMPGTRMTYVGMRRPTDRADLIAYLREN